MLVHLFHKPPYRAQEPCQLPGRRHGGLDRLDPDLSGAAHPRPLCRGGDDRVRALFKTFLEVNDVLRGPQGLAVANVNLFGWDFGQGQEPGPVQASFILNYELLALLLVDVGMMLVKRLERSWIGLNMDAIRLDDTASACFGIDLARWKITAFTLGIFLAGGRARSTA